MKKLSTIEWENKRLRGLVKVLQNYRSMRGFDKKGQEESDEELLLRCLDRGLTGQDLWEIDVEQSGDYEIST